MEITLKDLIDWLDTQDPSKSIKDGFGEAMSWRGSYYELAFEPNPVTTVREMLSQAKSAVGETFVGYKGGEFTMDLNCEVYIAEYGTCGEPITSFNFKYWELL